MRAPTPAEVDKKAAEYYALKDALDQATEEAKLRCLPLAELKTELIDLVRDFGSVRAEKSFLLHGNHARDAGHFWERGNLRCRSH
jgi:hypothetical protein